MRRKIWAIFAALAAAAGVFAAEPQVIFDGFTQNATPRDQASFRKWCKNFTRRQLSADIRMKFDRAGTKADLGFFTCELLRDGSLKIIFLPGRTELTPAPLVLTSQDKVDAGEEFDLAVNFSAERRRYSFYLNGKYQSENAIFKTPETLRWTMPDLAAVPGKVSRFRIYDAALESEELTPAGKTAADFDVLAARAMAIRSANPHLTGWCRELAVEAGKCKTEYTTIARYKRLAQHVENAEKMAADAAAGTAPAVVYSMSPTSQELLTPAMLPKSGKMISALRLFAAKGEYKPATLAIVPFQPVRDFTLRITDLKNEKGNVYKASEIEVKLIKRWYRAGGSWLNYFSDKHIRILVPDLLVNDDKIIRVDEFRQTNEFLLRYPEGARYADISRAEYDQTEFSRFDVPFRDADTLQSVELKEAGRNQLYSLYCRIPEDQAEGIYQGAIEMVVNGKVARTIPLTIRVLPFVLPRPRTYYDLNRTYFSHINSPCSQTENLFRKSLKCFMKYNLMHAGNFTAAAWQVKIAKEVGYPMDEIVGAYMLPKMDDWYKSFGGPDSLITDDMIPQLDRIFLKKVAATFKKVGLPEDTVCYPVFTSENDIYRIVKMRATHPADLLHKHTSVKRFSHSMTERYIIGAIDTADMDSSSRITPEHADLWHAAGGRIMNYSEPFPGPENPAWYRRKIGLEMYKANYDGYMMHGFRSRHLSEFPDWPEDPAYKNFGVVIPANDGFIERIALIGTSEAFNDVRYATMLCQLAKPRLESPHLPIRKEAKRQMAWLEKLDGKTYDMDAFRSGCALRIVSMLQLIRNLEGK